MTEPVSDESEREHEVTAVELFFDAVFVFAFTQVTALLVHDPTWGGVGRGALVLAAVWWAWNSYAWLRAPPSCCRRSAGVRTGRASPRFCGSSRCK